MNGILLFSLLLKELFVPLYLVYTTAEITHVGGWTRQRCRDRNIHHPQISAIATIGVMRWRHTHQGEVVLADVSLSTGMSYVATGGSRLRFATWWQGDNERVDVMN